MAAKITVFIWKGKQEDQLGRLAWPLPGGSTAVHTNSTHILMATCNCKGNWKKYSSSCSIIVISVIGMRLSGEVNLGVIVSEW